MATHTDKPIAILGAGAWGTALALYLSRRGQAVYLWSIETPQVEMMQRERTNNQYLPGYPFPETLHPETELATALTQAEDILLAVPSVGFREVLLKLKPLLTPAHRFLSATKGMDMETGQLLHQTFDELIGSRYPYAVISGPSFAKEVAAGLPTAVVIASRNQKLAEEFSKRFNSPLFRIDLSEDIIGVEIGGVVKNVLAIAAGISDGMKLGANARSTLITRGLNEMITLGKALSADNKTFEGLSGLGDLILTCTDDLSRNRRFGLALGQNMPKEQAEREIGQVVEGKRNAELLIQLAHRYSIKMKICEAVHYILQGKALAKEAMQDILA
ncbi:MAG TPA: NAD(P)H-dependent glycerol-3-phosphate dehydrogenase [Gammaproteobacteria bacterium]|nr:NAD(P)H-dependent glycerol-3-phosphate dehydrogenase [Gammaproteobacteria bacterium]